nr:sulfite oxidase, mitochondrial-like isoform X2 [Procambarus clarkii]
MLYAGLNYCIIQPIHINDDFELPCLVRSPLLEQVMLPRLLIRGLAEKHRASTNVLAAHLRYSQEHYHSNWEQQRRHKRHVAATLIGAGAGVALWLNFNRQADAASSLTETDKDLDKFGAYQNGLPEYTHDDVSKHTTMKDRVWVSYRHGVYDITDLIPKHPGGDTIMMGAGGSVEPFWALYAVHKNPHVLEWFETYRIGNLAPDDVGASVKDMSDPYSNEPRSELFYVRNHLPVPDVDEANYELEIYDEGTQKEKTFKLADIKKYPKYTITAAIQCGGNRRSEMAKVKPVKGLSWGQAAIGNATWSGTRLCDVLKDMGVQEGKTNALHIQFEGLDTDPASMPYGASIPIEKALDPHGDVILAYEMNGEPISRDHGYPLRVIVPGVVGARHVKWLGRIIVSKKESDAHWQQNDYKGFAPNVDWDTVDFTKSPAIQELPVISAICDPVEGEKVKVVDGKIKIRGYAWSGGGRKIIRVDVSGDGGKNWQEADVLESDDNRHPRAWGWTLWSAEIPVLNKGSTTQVCVKAVDSQYNTQPENFENIWNLRGVLANAYHRVNITLVK